MADDNKRVAALLERLVATTQDDDKKIAALLDRLLVTTQDMFIFRPLESGMAVHPIKTMVRVSTDRVTRISKLRPKKDDE